MSKLPDFKERLKNELFNLYVMDQDDFYCPVSGEFRESECRDALKEMNQFELMNEIFNKGREDIIIKLVEEFAE